MTKKTSYLISGGSGALGTALARQLMKDVTIARIVIFSRGEFRQHQMEQELTPLDRHKQLRFFIGDVRDRDRLKRAMYGVDVVIHAAALKRIEVGHYNPIEMVKTNVGGAINIIEAAQDMSVEKVLGVSSDKAYQPISPYGHSKAMAEDLFLASNNTGGWSGPKFAVCRYGNVWNSTGSVVPTWRVMKVIASVDGKNAVVPVTDPDCTRFFMTMDQAVDLVIGTIKTMKGGETAIPALPAYRLGDLADAMKCGMKVTGLPRWEKKHESMNETSCSETARQMTVEELREHLARIP